MYNIEVHNRINQIFSVFYRSGLWDIEDEASVRKMQIKLFYFVPFVLFVSSMAVRGLTTDDGDEFIFMIALSLMGVVTTIRMSYIIWKKKNILAFVHQIGVHSINDHEEFTQINHKLEILLKFMTTLMTISFIAVCCILALPLILGEKILPLNIWFPLDFKTSEFLYWTLYAFITGECLLSFICALLNVVVWYIMVNCVVKFEVLGNQFRHLGEIVTKQPEIKKPKITEAEKENLFFQDLIAAIESHQAILKLTEQFKSSFSNLFVTQLATSALCICGSIYVLAFSHTANIIQLGVYFSLLAYNIFDVFIVMYLGNEIQLSSGRLSYCVFESNWTDQSKSCRKCIVILMEILKQPHVLVILKLYPLNLETFMRILNGAYSMFNILQNLK